MAVLFEYKEPEFTPEVFDMYGIPDYMRDGILNYLFKGVPPGHFLTAVFENDLMEALSRADGTNMNLLPGYGKFLYNRAPRGCYGSPDNVKEWIKQGGLDGLSNE